MHCKGRDVDTFAQYFLWGNFVIFVCFYKGRIAWVLKFLNLCVQKILIMNLFSEISFRAS